MRSVNLSDTQLQIVMHLCNGLTIDEVAQTMNYSPTSINRFLASAKQRVKARSTVHLASIVIASGVLYYTDQGERVHLPLNDGTRDGAGLPAARYSA